MKAVTVAGGSSEKPKVEVPEEGPQPPEESSTPSTADLPDGETAAGATGRDAPEGAEGPAEGSGAGEPAGAGAEPNAEAGAGADAGPGSAAGAGEPPAEARPEAEAEPDPASGATDPDGTDTETAATETSDDDSTAPDTAPTAEAEAEAATDADSAAEHDAAPAAGAETEADEDPVDDTDASAGGELGPEGDPDRTGAPDAKATGIAGTKPAPADAERRRPSWAQGSEAGATPQPDAESGTEPEPEPASTSEATPKSTPESQAEPKPKPEPKSEAQAQATPERRSEPAPKPTPEPTPKPEPKSQATPKPTPEAEAEAEPTREAEPTPKPQPKSRAESTPKPQPKSRAEPTSGAEPESPPEPTPRSTPEPGSGADVDADDDADADDAERTSQFVALRPADGPLPAPQPTAALPAAPPAPAPWPVVNRPPAEAPLDLLAQLTNTAPPPETPRRTALRRVKIWTPILLVLAGAVAGAQLLRPLPDTKIVGTESLHTIDGQLTIPWPAKGQGAVRVSGSGDVGTFGEQKPVPTASVAKVMTAYVVLKGHPLRKGEAGPDIAVDAKAVADGTSESESRIVGLVAGTKYSQQDMLKMLMIPSGNNVARLLARWDTGTDSEAAFVEKMNAAAKELGMTDTVYTDPSGLDASTVSTAADQLKLAEAVMRDEAFRAVVALPDARIKGLPEPIYNNNDLLTAPGLSIRGIKTGSSTPAGGTLMWAAYKSVGDETPLVLGTLMDQRVASGPDPDGSNSLILVKANSKKIIEAVRAALVSTPVIRKGQKVGYVDDGLGGRTPLVATKDVNVVGVPGQPLRLSLAAAAGSASVPHTAKAGTELGVLTVGDGAGAKSVPVAVEGVLAEPSFGTRLTRLR